MKNYWLDSYTFSFESRIADIWEEGEQFAVILEETYFFPEGGGQPSDRGTIASHRVIDVQEREDLILHFLELDDQAKQVLKKRAIVSCEIDRNYRLHNMRTHSACHLLFGAARKLFPDVSYAGFNIGEVGSLYLETRRQIRNADARKMERLANEYVVADKPVSTSLVDADQAADMGGLAYNIDLPEGQVRIVEMEDCDLAACSGTHVRRTIEVGPIKIVGREIHSKNVTRIDYAVGKRAVAEIARDGQVLAEVAESLSASREQLGQIVHKMASDLRQAEKNLKELRGMLAEYRAQDLLDGGDDVAGVSLFVEVIDYLDSGSIRKMVAKAISERDSVVMALIGVDDKLTITAGRSDDIDIDLSSPIVAIAREHGGGGGGRPNFVSAGGIVASPGVIRDQVRARLALALQEQ